MVTFRLVEENNETAIFHYYPEDGVQFGIITLLKGIPDIEIITMAPNDFSREVTLQEVMSLRDSVNDSRKDNGEPPLTEEEWPTPTSGFLKTFYADHAISKSMKAFKDGVILKEGGAMWY